MKLSSFLGILVPLLAATSVHAHPVPKDTHDRHITVRLRPADKPDRVVVRIEYRVEVDELTAIHEDMKPFRDEVDPARFFNKPLDYYAHFARIYAPIYGDNLVVKANGQPVKLTPVSHLPALKDEKGMPLGHLRCDFVYEGELPLGDKGASLRVQELNYRDQEGQIFMALVNEAAVKIDKQVVPDGEMNKVHLLERKADHDTTLRNLSVDLALGASPVRENVQKPPANDVETPATGHHDGFLQLFRDLRQQGVGLTLLLLFFAGLGAVHALTPGHGKTLVAAYLVGEQGTIWHAIVLGLVTTITHTGSVLILAAVLFFLSASAREAIQMGLGLGMGLLIACMGFWLLLQRLAGRADHIHIGGGHHHHHHGDHHHDEPATRPGDRSLGWWGIVLLGMTGGLVPCWDAIFVLAYTAGTGEFWFALPALLAFSAGLAGVLVAIGIAVVKFKHFAGSRWGEGRFIRSLPIISACLITAMGLWLCFESVKHP